MYRHQLFHESSKIWTQKSMTDFPLQKLFRFLGFVQPKNSVNPFRKSKSTIHYEIYAFLILLLVHVYELYAMYLHMFEIVEISFHIERSEKVIRSVVVGIDYILWMITSSFQPVFVLHNRQKMYQIFKELSYLQSKTLKLNIQIASKNKRNLRRVVLSFTIIFGSAMPISFIKHNFFSNATLFMYFLFGTYFLAGHLYETIIFEKIKSAFEVIKCDINHETVKSRLDLYERLWKLSRKCRLIFSINKLVCLPCLKILVAIYWFYNVLGLLTLLIAICWDPLTLTGFIPCYAWHRLSSEVSSLSVFITIVIDLRHFNYS